MTTTDGNELKVYVNGEEQSDNPAMLPGEEKNGTVGPEVDTGRYACT